jgi:hypothetical protein
MDLKLEDNTPGLRVTLRFPNTVGETKLLANKAPRLLPSPEKSDKIEPPAAAAA